MEKKRLRYFEHIIPLLFIGICIFFWFRFKEFKKQIAEHKLSEKYVRESLVETKARTFYQLNSESSKLSNSIKLIDTNTLDTLSLLNLFKGANGRKKLIFRYSELSCMACVDSIIVNLKKMEKQLPKEDVIILTYYSKMRNLVLFARTNNVNFPIYGIIGNNLSLPIEKIKMPYLFITDEQLLANMVFIPDKRYPKETSNYLNMINKRFFKEY